MTAKKEPARRSLVAFAVENPPKRTGSTCWMCSIPERQECEEAIAKGVAKVTVFEWLRDECGYPPEIATRNRIEGHMKNHVTQAPR